MCYYNTRDLRHVKDLLRSFGAFSAIRCVTMVTEPPEVVGSTCGTWTAEFCGQDLFRLTLSLSLVRWLLAIAHTWSDLESGQSDRQEACAFSFLIVIYRCIHTFNE